MIRALFVQIEAMLTGRSSKWPAVRKAFLAGKCCEACGSTSDLEAHHIEPFHANPSRELDIDNLMALCTNGPAGINCHFTFGHAARSWKHWNANAKADASRYRAMRKNARFAA